MNDRDGVKWLELNDDQLDLLMDSLSRGNHDTWGNVIPEEQDLYFYLGRIRWS